MPVIEEHQYYFQTNSGEYKAILSENLLPETYLITYEEHIFSSKNISSIFHHHQNHGIKQMSFFLQYCPSQNLDINQVKSL